MSARSIHNHIGRLVAVAVAGAVFGVGGAVVAARPAQRAPQQKEANLAALAEWARAQHLSGLSPASLSDVGD